MTVSGETLIEVEGVSKKFCRSLKRSLWYGLRDGLSEVSGKGRNCGELRKREFWALKDISVSVQRGDVLGLIGSNGSGKTTLLRMINGLIKPDSGRITVRGRVGALIALGAGFNPILTGRENVYASGALLGLSTTEIREKYGEIVEFSELEEFMETPVQNYSSGMRLRLGFSVAAMLNPDILILDEVLTVGDIGFRAKCYGILGEKAEKCAIIIVSHSMPEIFRLCTSVMVLNKGRDIYCGQDIPEGVSCYYKLQKEPKGTIFKSRYGEITNVEIEATNALRPILTVFGSLSIKIHANLSYEILNPIIHIGILDQSLQNVWSTDSSMNCKEIKNKHGQISITAKIQSLPLKPGLYYVDIAIADERNINIITRTHLKYSIQIHGRCSGYGATIGLAHWEQAS